jgi:hypothetical protein
MPSQENREPRREGMPEPPRSDTKFRAILRNARLGLWALLVLALAYVVGVFYARRQENRTIEERAAAAKRAEAQRTVEMLGGERFEILNFYASPGIIRRGETTALCYSVSNAQSVRLEPQPNPVWPSYGRCVNVAPEKTTAYTLTAEDSSGNTKTATVTVEVH